MSSSEEATVVNHTEMVEERCDSQVSKPAPTQNGSSLDDSYEKFFNDEPPATMAPKPPVDDDHVHETIEEGRELSPRPSPSHDPIVPSSPVVCSVQDLSATEASFIDGRDSIGEDAACAIGADVCDCETSRSMEKLDLLPLTPPLNSSQSYSSGLMKLVKLNSNDAQQPACEMCSNYEMTMQQLQTSETNLKQHICAIQNQTDRYRTELSRERTQRQELELKFEKLNTESKAQIEKMTENLHGIRDDLRNAQGDYKAIVEELRNEMDRGKLEVNNSGQKVAHLELELQHLLGLHKEGSESLQNQQIDLPQNVEELQLMCLQLREELIETKLAKEHFQRSFNDQNALYDEQLTAERNKRDEAEENMAEEINALRTELGVARSSYEEYKMKASQADNLERQVNEFQVTIQDLEEKLKDTQNERADTQVKYSDLRQKTHNLQLELDNCETVQKDFVQLSQSLQIELEKIRQADKEVRWQNEEDCYLCGNCKQPFTKNRGKIHCRHCGKIFCGDCLKKSVASGPHRKPAKVCDVCHTLLARDTAPYFSHSVPST